MGWLKKLFIYEPNEARMGKEFKDPYPEQSTAKSKVRTKVKAEPKVKVKAEPKVKATNPPKYTKSIDTFIGNLPNLEYDFIALDFETANTERNSACALGIAAFRGKELVHNSAILINPCTDEWTFYDIHGIRPRDVVDAPLFSDIFTQLYPLLCKTYVIAHNVAFDSEVFFESSGGKGDSRSGLIWADSKDGIPTWAKGRYWKLDLIAEKLGLPLDHHNAGSDAKVAGQIWTTGMGEYRGDNRVSLPEKEIRKWPTPASLIVPPKVKIHQSAFDRAEADLLIRELGSIVSADFIRWSKAEEVFWALTVGKRQIGIVKGSGAQIVDDVVGDNFPDQKVNLSLSSNGYWETGKAEFLNDAPLPKGINKTPLRLPAHSQLDVKIKANQLNFIIDQIRGKSKRLNIKEVGNIRVVDGNLTLFHDHIYVGDLDMARHGPTARKFKDLCAEGYLPMVDYYIKLTNTHELELANVFYDLRWR